MIGKTLGHYKIIEKIGAGGMGVVYKAWDLHLDRFAALKILPPEKVACHDRKTRFVREAKAASDFVADLKRLKRDFESDPAAVLHRPARTLPAESRRKTGGKDWSGKQVNRLAVLPFENGSADPGTEYLSDGTAESLINNLSRLPRLQVMAHSTVFRFKGNSDPVEAARQLDVRAVLTGKVVQHRDTLIVSVELVDAQSGSHLWGERYQRKADEAAQILSEMMDLSQHRHVSGLNFALVYLGRGRGDRALDFLEQGHRERANWMPYIGIDPRFDPLRAEPRFQNLLRKMNLPG